MGARGGSSDREATSEWPAEAEPRRYLALHELRPFDVLLTLPKDSKGSKLIALATHGRFSHAALVVGRFVVFESVQDGVRFATWPPEVVRRADERVSLLRSVANYHEIIVRRHKEIAALDATQLEQLQRVLVGLTARFNALAYPPPSAFAEIAEGMGLPADIVSLVRTLGRITADVDGPFCSELVCRMMAAAEFSAVEHLSPRAVAPSTLADSNRLADVDEAIVTPDAGTVDVDLTAAGRMTTLRLERALTNFQKRKAMLKNVFDLRDQFTVEAGASGTSADRVARADVALSACIDNVMRYEREQVEYALQDEAEFVASTAEPRSSLALALGRCLSRFAEPEPPEHVLLRPLRQFLDDVGVNWGALAPGLNLAP